MSANTDPYVYPGTTVLKNRRDIRDPEKLAEFETEAVERRLLQLSSRPPVARFEASDLKAINRYLFQDVYSWAGEFRTVEMSKGGQAYFALSKRIEPALNRTMAELEKESYLKNLSPEKFAVRAAHYLGEINAVHPFREGNGRTQRELLRQLASNAGHRLDWSKIQPDHMTVASRHSFQSGNNTGFEVLLGRALGGNRHRRSEPPQKQNVPNSDHDRER